MFYRKKNISLLWWYHYTKNIVSKSKKKNTDCVWILSKFFYSKNSTEMTHLSTSLKISKKKKDFDLDYTFTIFFRSHFLLGVFVCGIWNIKLGRRETNKQVLESNFSWSSLFWMIFFLLFGLVWWLCVCVFVPFFLTHITVIIPKY